MAKRAVASRARNLLTKAKAGNPTVTVRVAAILEELGYERTRVMKSRVRSYVYRVKGSEGGEIASPASCP